MDDQTLEKLLQLKKVELPKEEEIEQFIHLFNEKERSFQERRKTSKIQKFIQFIQSLIESSFFRPALSLLALFILSFTLINIIKPGSSSNQPSIEEVSFSEKRGLFSKIFSIFSSKKRHDHSSS